MKKDDWNKIALQQFKYLEDYIDRLYKECNDEERDNEPLFFMFQVGASDAIKAALLIPDKLENYAKGLAKNYPKYREYQYKGKNGADSQNEKGYWRGMGDAVLAILSDWKKLGLIEHTGILNDSWPEEEKANENV